jgi:hypothetical protein
LLRNATSVYRINRLPTVFQVWFLMLMAWPILDSLRKFSALNQLLYPVQLSLPLIALLFLYKCRSLDIPRPVFFPLLYLFTFTLLPAFFFAVTNYGLSYLGVWFLSFSTLVGPWLLVCARFNRLDFAVPPPLPVIVCSISVVSVVFFVNNIITVIQSLVGKDHFLSVGAGGELGVQLTTNTAIELRAPGLFTFVTGNAGFSTIVTIFLLGSFVVPVSHWISLVRLLALGSLPASLLRSISRTFLFITLLVTAPFLTLIRSLRHFLPVFLALSLLLLLFVISPFSSSFLFDGFVQFQQRISDAGGVSDGIIQRFLSSFWLDAGGSEASLFQSFTDWFDENPLPALFGNGLGTASKLFRFSTSSSNLSYGFMNVGGKEILLGENGLSSAFSELGFINFFFYLWFLLSVYKHYFMIFPFSLSSYSAPASWACLFSLTYWLTVIYSRPSTLFAVSCSILTAFVCLYLSLIFMNRPPFLHLYRRVKLPARPVSKPSILPSR